METISFLNHLLEGKNLESDEARLLMRRIMEGEIPPVLLAALLVALRMKGETPVEVAAFAEVMREKSVDLSVAGLEFIDTCGTGGDQSHSFNISTAAAIIACGAGCRIAKHGNRSVSSRSGSADVLIALGIPIEVEPEKVRECLRQVGIGFLFAPLCHTAMRHVMPVRKELGARTVFNILGPLTNPARAKRQIIGVFDDALCRTYGEILRTMGHEAAYIVHGHGPLDEVSLSGPTHVVALEQGELKEFQVTPEDFGLESRPIEAVRGGEPDENAVLLLKLLQGEDGPHRDIACMNAAFAIHLARLAPTLKDGYHLAVEAVSSGRAMAVLDNWRNLLS